jgi:hypothetical protein
MNRRVRSTAWLGERFVTGRYEFDTIAEGVGGKGPIDAPNRFWIALHFDACGMQRFEEFCEIRDQKCWMSFLGCAKVSFNAEMHLQRTTLKPTTATRNKIRRLGHFG